jgi:hypothetical protein
VRPRGDRLIGRHEKEGVGLIIGIEEIKGDMSLKGRCQQLEARRLGDRQAGDKNRRARDRQTGDRYTGDTGERC